MTAPRWVRDNTIRAAFAVITLDWIFVRPKTFFWLDVAALVALLWAANTPRNPNDLA